MANILKSQKLLSLKKYLTLFNLTPKYYYSKTTVIDHDPTIKVCLSILSSSFYYHSFFCVLLFWTGFPAWGVSQATVGWCSWEVTALPWRTRTDTAVTHPCHSCDTSLLRDLDQGVLFLNFFELPIFFCGQIPPRATLTFQIELLSIRWRTWVSCVLFTPERVVLHLAVSVLEWNNVTREAAGR